MAKNKSRRSIEKTLYDSEVKKIQEKLNNLEVGTDEYDRVWGELAKMVAIEEKSKENKRKFTKEGRGQFWLKILGFFGLGGLIFMTNRFERQGNMYTGENRRWIDNIIGIAGKWTR